MTGEAPAELFYVALQGLPTCIPVFRVSGQHLKLGRFVFFTKTDFQVLEEDKKIGTRRLATAHSWLKLGSGCPLEKGTGS